MGQDKNKEEMEKGFVVRDRRFSAKQEDSQATEEESKKEEPVKEESKKEDFSEQQIPLPEVNFGNFLLSLHTSALIQLGEIQDPNAGQALKDLPLAKQTIDLVGMLKEKTRGNLAPEEEKMMEAVLYDLRIRYVKAAG